MAGHRVIITGGSGFVGTNLVEHFSQQGWEVRNFDIAAPRNPDHFRFWTNLNILDQQKLIDETHQFQAEVFLHFAARTDLLERKNLAGYAANTEGVRNVIEAIRSTHSIQRTVFASSQLVCELGYRPQQDWDYRPSTLYGESKVVTERLLRDADDIGAVWTILRPTSLWGPWFDVPYKNLFTAIARNLYFHPGHYSTLKQWGFVGNSVYQVNCLLEAPAEEVHRRTFYLADYQPVELRDFTNKVQEALRVRPIKTMPGILMKMAASSGDVLAKIGWTSPPMTTFRFQNMITEEIQNLAPLQEITGRLPYSLEEGIDLTVRWMSEYDEIIRVRS